MRRVLLVPALVLPLVLPLVLATSPAAADRRLFTSTYEYQTLPQGHTSLELWHTQTRSTWDSSDAGASTTLEHALEIEHGLTEHWDASLYVVFTQLASDDPALESQPYSFHELKLDTRYRFADRGEWPVDTVVYAHVAKEFAASVYTTEARAIFARNFDAVAAAVNVVGGVRYGSDVPDTQLSLGWAAGVSYELHPKLNVGVETYGAVALEDDEVLASVGPAIALAPSNDFWVTVTAGFGLGDAPAVAGRMLLGIEL